MKSSDLTLTDGYIPAKFLGERAPERRSAERAPLNVTIEIQEANGFSFHSTHNLSEGGAYFDRAIPYEKGSRVECTLYLPGELPIACAAIVANVPDNGDFGMGLRFVELDPADQARLAAFTVRRRGHG